MRLWGCSKSPFFAVGFKNLTQTPKKAQQVRSSVSVMLSVFFDCEGIIHHEFWPHCQMVNKDYYLKVMKMLREAVRRKGPDLWRRKNGCFIMTMLWHIYPSWFMIFSQNMRQCLSPSLCTWQNSHQQTYISLPCWNPYWKDDNLRLSRRLKRIHWDWYIKSG